MEDQLVALMYDVSDADRRLRLQILPKDATELVRKYHMQMDIATGGYIVFGINNEDVLQAADMLIDKSRVSPVSGKYDSWEIFEEQGTVNMNPAESLDTMEDRDYYQIADFVFEPGQRAEVTGEIVRILSHAD